MVTYTPKQGLVDAEDSKANEKHARKFPDYERLAFDLIINLLGKRDVDLTETIAEENSSN